VNLFDVGCDEEGMIGECKLLSLELGSIFTELIILLERKEIWIIS